MIYIIRLNAAPQVIFCIGGSTKVQGDLSHLYFGWVMDLVTE